MGVFPSGQWGQTVNLLLFSFGGSNPPAPTKQEKSEPLSLRTKVRIFDLVETEGFEPLTSRMRTERSPSNIAFVHTLCTAREEKSTYIRPYRIFCHLNYLSWSQIWSPSRWFSRWSCLGRNMVGGQVSYRPLRCNSHGVQMYRISIRDKIRCIVKAQLQLWMNGSCAFIFIHNTFQKEDAYG